jgi:hypothetical protein
MAGEIARDEQPGGDGCVLPRDAGRLEQLGRDALELRGQEAGEI